MVGDIFYKLDGVFLKGNDDPLKVLISDPCPTSYSAQLLRTYVSHDHLMSRGMVTTVIKKLHAFVPDSTWLREFSSDSSSTHLPPAGVSLMVVCGGVRWCMVVYDNWLLQSNVTTQAVALGLAGPADGSVYVVAGNNAAPRDCTNNYFMKMRRRQPKRTRSWL